MRPRTRKVIERLEITVQEMSENKIYEETLEFRGSYFAPRDIDSGIGIFMSSTFSVDYGVLEIRNLGDGYYKVRIANDDRED